MRKLFYLPLILIVGCASLADALRPDIPQYIANEQIVANKLANEVLENLKLWITSPDLIPPDAAATTHKKIIYITKHLTEIRNWMITNPIDKKVTQTIIDLLVAWEDYIDHDFCIVSDAWLKTKKPMTADDSSKWFQVFVKMQILHKKLWVWMQQKGIKDD